MNTEDKTCRMCGMRFNAWSPKHNRYCDGCTKRGMSGRSIAKDKACKQYIDKPDSCEKIAIDELNTLSRLKLIGEHTGKDMMPEIVEIYTKRLEIQGVDIPVEA